MAALLFTRGSGNNRLTLVVELVDLREQREQREQRKRHFVR